MKTIQETFEEYLAENALPPEPDLPSAEGEEKKIGPARAQAELELVRLVYFSGASSAVVSILSDTPGEIDAWRVHHTVMEYGGFLSGAEPKNPAGDPRVRTLLTEWNLVTAEAVRAARRVPRTERYREIFYKGAGACLALLFDEDAYRMDVRKVPVLMAEIMRFVDTLPETTAETRARSQRGQSLAAELMGRVRGGI